MSDKVGFDTILWRNMPVVSDASVGLDEVKIHDGTLVVHTSNWKLIYDYLQDQLRIQDDRQAHAMAELLRIILQEREKADEQ